MQANPAMAGLIIRVRSDREHDLPQKAAQAAVIDGRANRQDGQKPSCHFCITTPTGHSVSHHMTRRALRARLPD
jgi:hypothetical protein